MITCKNLSLSFGDKTIINNFNYNFPEVGLVGILGPSGCGKTTLLNILSKNINTYDGNVEFNNIEKIDIFYNRYMNNLIEGLTVKQNIKFYLTKEERKKALYYIKYFNLSYLLKRKVDVISSGENQKIDMCIAFSKEAKILILDEPFSNVDDNRELYYEEFKKLSKDKLIIVTGHNIEDMPFDIKITFENGDILIKEINRSSEKNNVITLKRKYSFINAIYYFKTSRKMPFFIMLIISFLTLACAVISISINCTSDLALYKRALESSGIQFINTSFEGLDEYASKIDFRWRMYTSDFENTDERNLIYQGVYITDTLYYQGEDLELVDNTIYISDYMYSLLKTDGLWSIDYKDYIQSYIYIPDELCSEFEDINVNFSFLIQDTTTSFSTNKLDVVVYDTNYEDYIPSQDAVAIDKREFYYFAEDNYMYVFMNQNTIKSYFSKDKGFIILDDGIIKISSDLEGNYIMADTDYLASKYYEIYGFYPEIIGLVNNYFGLEFSETFVNLNYEISVDLEVVSGRGYASSEIAENFYTIYVSQEMFDYLYDNLHQYDLSNFIIVDKYIYFVDTSISKLESITNLALVDDNIVMSNELLMLSLISQREENEPLLIALFIVSLVLFVGIIICYFIFYSIKEYKKMLALEERGFSKLNIISLKYTFGIIFSLICICLVIIISYYLYLPLSIALGIAF